MNNKHNQGLKQSISKDAAIELLFGNEGVSQTDNNCFDEYGNYSFPTDIVVNTPNTAIGTAVGLSFIDEFWLYDTPVSPYRSTLAEKQRNRIKE